MRDAEVSDIFNILLIKQRDSCSVILKSFFSHTFPRVNGYGSVGFDNFSNLSLAFFDKPLLPLFVHVHKYHL